MNELSIFIDGASSGNPGPSGVGILIKDTHGKEIKKISYFIDHATNNIAEYMALIIALWEAVNIKGKNLKIYTDSLLLHQQLIGKYKVKDFNLRSLFRLIKYQENFFDKIVYNYIERGKNKEADKLAKRAIRKRL
jgi:ribonuclease HI